MHKLSFSCIKNVIDNDIETILCYVRLIFFIKKWCLFVNTNNFIILISKAKTQPNQGLVIISFLKVLLSWRLLSELNGSYFIILSTCQVEFLSSLQLLPFAQVWLILFVCRSVMIPYFLYEYLMLRISRISLLK